MYKIGKNILLETSRDKLLGFITIVTDEENQLQYNTQELISEISGIFKFGLDRELLSKYLKGKVTGEKLCIAKGIKPIDGKDGSISYTFELDRPLSPMLNNDGTVNYKELDSINNVKSGDILANIIPPSNGEDGKNVQGETIQHIKGRMPRFRPGKNVAISDDGMSLKANIDGLVELKNGKVSVSNVLNLESIDSSTGNIDFDGSVIINKDILNGFKLMSKGFVEVRGALEGGYVESTGDILVRQGIQGYNKLTVDTRGNLSTKFIENSIIKVESNITSEAIMHSDVSSGSNILVLGRKGLIVGGTIKAKNEIRARIIGSTMATSTTVEVGMDPNIKEKHDTLFKELEKTRENLRKIEQSLNVLEVMKRSSKLDSKKLELYNELVKAQLTLSIETNKLSNKFEDIKEEMENLSRGKVKVSDTIYPGVKIIIGKSFYHVRDEMKRCTFYEDGGEIRVGPY